MNQENLRALVGCGVVDDDGWLIQGVDEALAPPLVTLFRLFISMSKGLPSPSSFHHYHLQVFAGAASLSKSKWDLAHSCLQRPM